MSNQDYYQSFQQSSGYPATTSTPASSSENYGQPPPSYGQNYGPNYAQGGTNAGQYPPQQSENKEFVPGNQESFYRAQNDQSNGYQGDSFQAPGAPGEERGLAGAVTGAAAGGYAGHKVHHGVLGTVGGAVLGSITESAIKKHNKKEERQEAYYDHNQGPNMFSSGMEIIE
ncbi:hypothetical protein N7456_002406 [Penicillium angulare]|uniref:Glycine zipper 2TM domain-containing protein n=1 Tax=Penicillium angulare TaxID=116970 RepID=A0A9W9G9D0_9EURO|nr:hypothetical protein N7456_002406 [Penicillium angulare]